MNIHVLVSQVYKNLKILTYLPFFGLNKTLQAKWRPCGSFWNPILFLPSKEVTTLINSEFSFHAYLILLHMYL